MFFFNDTANTEIYTFGHTLSLHDALPISAAGMALLTEVECAFLALQEASNRHIDGGAAIRISAAPAFASAWLIPRLGRFTAGHPTISVGIETETRIVDLRREPVDLAIRHEIGRAHV